MTRIQIINLSVVAALSLMIVSTFSVQFKVASMTDVLEASENDIVSYKDEMRLLEIEWVYLTRPERIRELSGLYLENSGYTLASQIKKADQLEGYYLANYKKAVEKEEEVEVVSF